MWLSTAALLSLILCTVALSMTTVSRLPGFSGDLPFTLETGYVGVGKLEEVQFFYYFVESNRDPSTDPIILWFTGGPGCSTFTAFFYEIGPLKFNYENVTGKVPWLEINPYSWTQVANIIFLDSPVGTGFSYATTQEGYYTTNSLTAAQIYEFLRKWFLKHPRFLHNQLYIGGDSYSGIFVPIVVQHIYDGNKDGLVPQMNIQGYVLGNPVTDKNNDENWRIPYAHRMGLLSDEIYESAKTSCNGEYMDVDPNNTACVKVLEAVTACTDSVYTAMILEPTCNPLSPKPDVNKWGENFEENLTDFLRTPTQTPKLWCRSQTYLFVLIWANDKDVQKALNIREGTITEWVRCNESLALVKNIENVVDYHRNLSSVIHHALVYSGDHDMVIPDIATQGWIRTLNFSTYTYWKPWMVDGQSGGFSVVYDKEELIFTYATVKGGGHTAPEYQPKECFAMIYRWLAHYPL